MVVTEGDPANTTRRRSPRPFTSWAHPLTAISSTRQIDSKCPSCGEELQTVERWLQWHPNAVALRQQLFGEPFPPLSVLTINPDSVLALARKTLL